MAKRDEREKINKLMSMVTRAKKTTKEIRDSWDWAIEAYENTRQLDTETIKKQFPLIYNLYYVKTPFLFSRMPIITARARKPEDYGASDLVENILRDVMNKSGAEAELRKAALWAIVTGCSFVKLGFFSNTNTETIDPEEAAEGDEVNEDGTITREALSSYGVWADHVRNQDIIIDPDSEKLESSSFVAHRIKLTVKQFKEQFGHVKDIHTIDSEYDETDEDTPGVMSSEKLTDEEKQSFRTVYEIWSKEDNKRYVICKGYDKFLINEDWPHKLKKYPFEMVVLSEALTHKFGINEPWNTRDGIIAELALLNKRYNKADTANTGMLTTKGSADEDQMGNLTKQNANGFYEVNDIMGFREFSTAGIHPDMYNISAELNQLNSNHSQVSAETRQNTSQKKQTATEASIRSQASNVIMENKVSQFEAFVARIAQKTIELVKQYYEWPEVVRIDSKYGGQPQFKEWVGIKSIGEFGFEVKAGSASWRDNGLKQEQNMRLTQLVMQGAQTGLIPNPGPGLRHLIKDAMDNLGGVPTEIIDSMFQQQPAVTAPAGPVNAPVGGGAVQSPAELATGRDTTQTQNRRPTATLGAL